MIEKRNNRLLAPLVSTMLASGLLGGCATLGSGSDSAFELQILHAADMDGAAGALGNVRNFSALVDYFSAQHPDNTIKLSSGDNYIPGPRYFAASDDATTPLLGVPGNGRGDMFFLNAMGFQASAVGNHELDGGTGEFASIFSAEVLEDDPETPDVVESGTYPGAAFPYLSANLDFSTDENLAGLVAADGEQATDIAGKLAAYSVIDVNGESIGVVGASTPNLASITSTGGISVMPGDANDIAALAADIQESVDALTATGIDKIILLSHMQQISVERALAPLLSGVDVIIAGGSNSLLVDEDDTVLPGDNAVGTYPESHTSVAGEPVLIVNTEADYKYLGRLVVRFDDNGHILTDELDASINGAWAATDDIVASLDGATVNAEVDNMATALEDILQVRDGNIIGKTSVYLDGRRSQVRSQETNMGNLTADANLWVAQMEDASTVISWKNGGGIRAAIGQIIQPPGSNDSNDAQFLPPPANESAGKSAGDISEFDLQGTLRFNNGLTLITVTAAELVDIIEYSVAASEEGATPGRFPQVAGLQFSFDPSEPAREGSDTNGDTTVAGSRLRSLELVDADGAITDTIVTDGEMMGDGTRSFRMVILDFLASCVGEGASDECGDGYPLKDLSAPNRVDITADPGLQDFADAGSEQDALAEYLANLYSETPYEVAETPASEDMRIRNLSVTE